MMAGNAEMERDVRRAMRIDQMRGNTCETEQEKLESETMDAACQMCKGYENRASVKLQKAELKNDDEIQMRA